MKVRGQKFSHYGPNDIKVTKKKKEVHCSEHKAHHDQVLPGQD